MKENAVLIIFGVFEVLISKYFNTEQIAIKNSVHR